MNVSVRNVTISRIVTEFKKKSVDKNIYYKILLYIYREHYVLKTFFKHERCLR